MGDKDTPKGQHSQSYGSSLQSRPCSRLLSIFILGLSPWTVISTSCLEQRLSKSFQEAQIQSLCTRGNCYQNPPSLPSPSVVKGRSPAPINTAAPTRPWTRSRCWEARMPNANLCRQTDQTLKNHFLPQSPEQRSMAS